MKLRTDVERQIYATAFVRSFGERHDRGVTDAAREWAKDGGRDLVECWEATIAMQSIEDAEGYVALYRKGQKEAQRP